MLKKKWKFCNETATKNILKPKKWKGVGGGGGGGWWGGSRTSRRLEH